MSYQREKRLPCSMFQNVSKLPAVQNIHETMAVLQLSLIHITWKIWDIHSKSSILSTQATGLAKPWSLWKNTPQFFRRLKYWRWLKMIEVWFQQDLHIFYWFSGFPMFFWIICDSLPISPPHVEIEIALAVQLDLGIVKTSSESQNHKII